VSDLGGDGGFEIPGRISIDDDELVGLADKIVAATRTYTAEELKILRRASDAKERVAKEAQEKIVGQLRKIVGQTDAEMKQSIHSLISQFDSLNRVVKDVGSGALGAAGVRKAGEGLKDLGSTVKTVNAAINAGMEGIEHSFAEAGEGADKLPKGAREALGDIKVIINQFRAEFNELARAAEIGAERTRDAIAKQAVIQQTGESNRIAQAARQRELTQFRQNLALQRREVDLSNSRIRISEQASNQQRLARSQQFYKTIGQFAQESARQTAQNIGLGFKRLLAPQQDYENQSLASTRAFGNRRANEMESAARREMSIWQRSFTSRATIAERELAADATRFERLNARSQTGLAGVATGQSLAGGALRNLAFVGGGAFGITKILNTVSEFQGSIAELGVASDATAPQLEAVRKKAVELGNDVKLPGVSAKDAADAMKILAVSGISLQTSLDGGGRAVLALSRALGADAADAAKAVAAGVNVFGLSGKDAIVVADGLATAAVKSGSSLSELSDALAQGSLQFQSTFKTAASGKENFADFSATLAIFAKNGLRGQDAATSLKTALQAMVGRGAPGIKMLKQIAKNAGESGTVLFDASGKTRKFGDAVDILRRGINAMSTDQQKATAIQKVFGSDASRAANLLITNADSLRKMSTEMVKEGAAAELAAAKNQGFKAGLDAFGSTLETIAILNLQGLSSALGNVLIKFAEFFTALATGDGVMKHVRTGLVGVAAALGAILLAKGAVEVFGLLKVAMGALLTPMGVFTVGLAGAGAAIALLVKNSPELRKQLTEVGRTIRTKVTGALEDLTQGFQQPTEASNNFFEKLGSQARDAKVQVTGALDDIQQGLKGGLAVQDGEVNFFERLGVTVASVVPKVMGGIHDISQGLRREAGDTQNFFERVGLTVRTFAGRLRAAGKNLLGGFLGDDTATGAFAKIGDAAQKAVVYVGAFGRTIGELLTSGFQGGNQFGGVAGWIENLGESARGVRDLVVGLIDDIGRLFSSTDSRSFGTKLADVFSNAGGVLNDVLGGIPEKIGGFIRRFILDPLDDVFSALGDTWKRAFGDGFNPAGILLLIRDVGLRLGRTITGVLTDPNVLMVVGGLFAGLAVVAVSAVQGLLQGVLESVGRGLLRLPIVGDLLGLFKGLGKQIALILSAAILTGLAFGAIKGPMQAFTGFMTKQARGIGVAYTTAFKGAEAGASRLRAIAERDAAASQREQARGRLVGQTGILGRLLPLNLDAQFSKSGQSARRAFDRGFGTAGTSHLSGALPLTSQEGKFKASLGRMGTMVNDFGIRAGRAITTFGDRVNRVIGGLSGGRLRIDTSQITAGVQLAGEKFATLGTRIQTSMGNAITNVRTRFAEFQQDPARVEKAVQNMQIGVTGLFSGMALASDNLAVKVGGLAGSITAIGTAAATGNFGGVAIGLATTAIGFFLAKSQEAKKSVDELKVASKDFAEAILEAGQGSINLMAPLEAAKSLTKIFKDNAKGLKELTDRASDFGSNIQTAFAEVATGKVGKGLQGISDAFDDIYAKGTKSRLATANLKDEAKAAGVALKDLQISPGVSAATVRSQADLDKLVGKIREGRIATGDWENAFNDFSLEKINGELVIMERGFEGLSEESRDLMKALATGSLSVAQGIELAKGPLGDVIRDQGKAADAQERLRTLADLYSTNVNKVKSAWEEVRSAILDAINPLDVVDQASQSAEESAGSVFAAFDAFKTVDADGNITGVASQIGKLTEEALRQAPALRDVGKAFKGEFATAMSTGLISTLEAARTSAEGIRNAFIENARQIGGDNFANIIRDSLKPLTDKDLQDAIAKAPVPKVEVPADVTIVANAGATKARGANDLQSAAEKHGGKARVSKLADAILPEETKTELGKKGQEAADAYSKPFAASVVPAVEGAGKESGKAFTKGVGSVNLMASFGEPLQTLQSALGFQFQQLGEFSATKTVDGLKAGLPLMAPAFSSALTPIPRILSTLFSVIKTISSLGGTIAGATAGMKFTEAFGAVLSRSGLGEIVARALGGVGNAVVNFANAFVGGIDRIFTSLESRIGRVSGAISSSLLNLIGVMQRLGIPLGGGIVPNAEGGIYTRPTLGLLGEAGKGDVVLPIGDERRAWELLQKSGLFGLGPNGKPTTGPTMAASTTPAVKFEQNNHFNEPGLDEEALALFNQNRTRNLLAEAGL
jgi:TP901 family phage tail tape measure protein